MTSAHQTLPQRRSRETRDRLLEAATTVFARRGYALGTVDEIAAEAGVSMGALYHHFDSKDALFRAILEQHLRDARMELSVLQQATSLRDAIERFVDYWVRHIADEGAFDEFFLECWAQASREDFARDAIIAFQSRGLKLIGDALRLGQAGGFIRTELDADAAALLMFATLDGIGLTRLLDPAGVSRPELRDALVEMFVGLLAGDVDADADVPGLQAGLTAFFARAEEEERAAGTDR